MHQTSKAVLLAAIDVTCCQWPLGQVPFFIDGFTDHEIPPLDDSCQWTDKNITREDVLLLGEPYNVTKRVNHRLLLWVPMMCMTVKTRKKIGETRLIHGVRMYHWWLQRQMWFVDPPAKGQCDE